MQPPSPTQVQQIYNTFNLASSFIGTGLETWNTAAVYTLNSAFEGASVMTGYGLAKWDLSAFGVDGMANVFGLETGSTAAGLTSCSKRRIADAWTVEAFKLTLYTDWYVSDTCPEPLTDAQFKQATWDYVQNTAAATAKWDNIGFWDVSEVKDFSHAFSVHRDQAGGSYVANGNPKAATFVGTHLAAWITSALVDLAYTFNGASAMNADVRKWNVAQVTTLEQTFSGASKFRGTRGTLEWNE
jgi:hypothetical protein